MKIMSETLFIKVKKSELYSFAHYVATVIAWKDYGVCKQTECLIRESECTWRKHWNHLLKNAMEVQPRSNPCTSEARPLFNQPKAKQTLTVLPKGLIKACESCPVLLLGKST